MVRALLFIFPLHLSYSHSSGATRLAVVTISYNPPIILSYISPKLIIEYLQSPCFHTRTISPANHLTHPATLNLSIRVFHLSIHNLFPTRLS